MASSRSRMQRQNSRQEWLLGRRVQLKHSTSHAVQHCSVRDEINKISRRRPSKLPRPALPAQAHLRTRSRCCLRARIPRSTLYPIKSMQSFDASSVRPTSSSPPFSFFARPTLSRFWSLPFLNQESFLRLTLIFLFFFFLNQAPLFHVCFFFSLPLYLQSQRARGDKFIPSQSQTSSSPRRV